MPKEFSRIQRVSELIRRELGTVIAREMDDPRVRFVSVTAVDVSKDLKNAKVYVTRIETDDGPKIDIRALQKAAGFLRKRLADTLTLKSIPALTFVYDNSIERGVKLTRLIEDSVSQDGKSGH
jgi:ribosome-binding factor A